MHFDGEGIKFLSMKEEGEKVVQCHFINLPSIYMPYHQ
jgi:hypothetical protein